jgi:hypothetical protein
LKLATKVPALSAITGYGTNKSCWRHSLTPNLAEI